VVRIRMQRLGRRNLARYRLVVMDARNKRQGKCLERLGHYDPTKKDSEKFVVDLERYQYWIGQGAQASEAVAALLKQQRTVKAKGAATQA
jgi:small subunit ribosomal protein S16